MEFTEDIDREELERRVRENEDYLNDLKARGESTDLGAGEVCLFIAVIAAVCIASFFWR